MRIQIDNGAQGPVRIPGGPSRRFFRAILPLVAATAGTLIPSLASAQTPTAQDQALSQLTAPSDGETCSADGSICLSETEPSLGTVQMTVQLYSYCFGKMNVGYSINGLPWSPQTEVDFQGGACNFGYTFPVSVPTNSVFEVHAQVCSGGVNDTCGNWATTYINTAPNPRTFTNQRLLVGNMCLDVEGGVAKNGAKIDIWPCTGDQANQSWTMRSDGTIRTALNPNMCLDLPASDTVDNTPLDLWTCNGGTNQEWSYQGDNTLRGFGAKCANLPGGDLNETTPVVYWDCQSSGAPPWNEVWSLQAQP
jgi:hypothetical protein